MKHTFCDVLVIGSGAAGLRAAISAKKKGLNVCVISKQAPGKSTCTTLSAGVFAATEENKSADNHLKRTLQAGRGINQKELVKFLFKWADHIAFKIEGQEIVVNDLNEFTSSLDAQFADWDEKELSKDGKI